MSFVLELYIFQFLMQDTRFTKMLNTYSEVNLTAAHYIIQKSILLHYLKISNSDQHLFKLWC